MGLGIGLGLKIGKGGGGAVPTWTPALPIGGLTPALWAIAGVENYQEASSPTTPADGDGEGIGYINDQSASNNDLARHNDDSRRAVLKLNIIGGEPVARFDGTGDNYLIANTIINTSGFLIFVVCKMTDLAANRTILAENNGTSRMFLGHTTTNFEARFGPTGTMSSAGNQVKAADTNAHILTMEWTGSAVNLYVDGVAGSGTGTLSIDSTVLRRLGYSNVGFIKGDIAEVICYIGSLTEAQRQQVEGYLTARFF